MLAISSWPQWSCGTIWCHKFLSTLAQVMACCLVTLRHYVNPCWFIISRVLCHSPKWKLMALEMLVKIINIKYLKIEQLRSELHPPGNNELMVSLSLALSHLRDHLLLITSKAWHTQGRIQHGCQWQTTFANMFQFHQKKLLMSALSSLKQMTVESYYHSDQKRIALSVKVIFFSIYIQLTQLLCIKFF